jgi:hypothetical protein
MKEGDLSSASATVESFKKDSFFERTHFKCGNYFYVNNEEIAAVD